MNVVIADANETALDAARGELGNAHALARQLYRNLYEQHGPDHHDTLIAASALANVLYEMGRFAEARDLNEDTLARQRRILGWDHPDTQRTARNLDADLPVLGWLRNFSRHLKSRPFTPPRPLGESLTSLPRRRP